MSRSLIEHHESLPSTMDRARVLAEQGAPGGTVVVADFQSAGRGTRGRVWQAPPGSCLMFTLVARPCLEPSALSDLPAAVGASIARYLQDALQLDCTVKPPNDIMIGGRKLCGVLCTSKIVGERVEYVLCGIGLNSRMTTEQLPLETATSIRVALGHCPDHETLLDGLLATLGWLVEQASG
ncbi:MAG: biotin--[acetyl-CoA-carboxylase] ligase [Thermomicrobiales bacterium]|nr:biotin--[acetyl-CoA-carboxylase] ligase [Thermomicrobiales bacterium]